MMNTSLSKNAKVIMVMLYLLVGLVFVFGISSIPDEYITNYFMVLFSYYFVVAVWFYYIFEYGFYIFEPATMVLALTIMTFSIAPMISMQTDKTTLKGFEVYDGCIKATLIYMIAMVVFMVTYYRNVVFGAKSRNNTLYQYEAEDSFIKDKSNSIVSGTRKVQLLLVLAYLFTIIGVGVSLIDLIKQGYSLSYILSFGTNGSLDTSEDSVGVFLNLRYFMIPGFLYLDVYSNRKLPKTILIIIAIACLFMRNKRWIIVILVLSPVVLYYYRNKKKPNTKLIVAIAVPMMIIIGAMQYMRGISTSITSIDWSNFSLLSIWEAFEGNFDLYKTLYGAVTYFPNEHFYTLGQQLVYLTLVTCIPRAIWPSKPISIIDSELKEYFLGTGAVSGHWSYAQLTEFYIEFGIIGVVVCVFIFAKFCKMLKRKYEAPMSIHDIILSASWFPMLMQLVIRGYMPINFWAMFFMWVPIFVMKIMSKIKIEDY